MEVSGTEEYANVNQAVGFVDDKKNFIMSLAISFLASSLLQSISRTAGLIKE